MVGVVWGEVLHPWDVARGALKVQINREIGESLKDTKDCIFVHLHVVLLDFLSGVHENLDNLAILDCLSYLEGRENLRKRIKLWTAVEVC